MDWTAAKYAPTADQIALLERALRSASPIELPESSLASADLADRRSGLRDVVRQQRGSAIAVEGLGIVVVTNRTVDKAKGGVRSAAECAAYSDLDTLLARSVVAYEADDELGNPDLRIVRLVARVRLSSREAVLKITVKRQLDRDPHLVVYNVAEVES